MTDEAPIVPPSRRGWRKFALAAFFAIVGAVALFAGKLDARTFLELATACMGLYGGSNIIDKRLGGCG